MRVSMPPKTLSKDVAWSDAYKSVRTVYCKGVSTPGCRPLPNVGRDTHTYLSHIVANYDRLAEWTVFSQALVWLHMMVCYILYLP